MNGRVWRLGNVLWLLALSLSLMALLYGVTKHTAAYADVTVSTSVCGTWCLLPVIALLAVFVFAGGLVLSWHDDD